MFPKPIDIDHGKMPCAFYIGFVSGAIATMPTAAVLVLLILWVWFL